MHIDSQHQMQLRLGLFEREMGAWLIKFARGVATGIDVGAGEGEYTLFLLTSTNIERVLAFEPASEARESLKSNLPLNALAETERLILSDKFVGAHEDIDTVTLDSRAALIKGPCFIKIDVEGHEADVLRGAKTLLAAEDVRLIIETHSTSCESTCLSFLRSLGFNTTTVSQAWWRTFLPERRPAIHNRWIAAWKCPLSHEVGGLQTE